MSDDRRECERFERWLLDAGPAPDTESRPEHVEACPECREQWRAHRLLVESLAGREIPELSPHFDARLDRKLAAEVEIRPLRGWRRAAMLGYTATALALLAWAVSRVPLPAIDAMAPFTAIAVAFGVPLTFLLAIAASRWMPGPQPPGGGGTTLAL